MDNKRRNFLKIAGVSTLAGLGGTAVFDRFIAGTVPASAKAAGEKKGVKNVVTGKRLGMIVDLKKFYDQPELLVKVEQACHQHHNVPDFPDKKDEIRWIWPVKFKNAFPYKSKLYKDDAKKEGGVPVFCNQCDTPPCVKVCPTKATFVDNNGIIVMDYHRCIGCRFCMVGCPYGMRSFNWFDPRKALDMDKINPDMPTRGRGVVEKCNFCADLIGRGKIPKCVEACGDTKAMIFGDLNDPDSEIRKVLRENFTIQRNPTLGTYPSVFYIV
jgi:molybdopterin-containing oxidoreductase family iron-sulfur binding subunit